MKTLLLPAVCALLLLATNSTLWAQKAPIPASPLPIPILAADVPLPMDGWSDREYLPGQIYIMHTISAHFYPLLPVVFFDSGSAVLPGRYYRLSSSGETRIFTENGIQGGTFERYYWMLDVMGKRLRESPKATVELIGNISAGEPEQLARQRAEIISHYWRNLWGIDEERIHISTTGKVHSTLEETEEARRVDILVDDRTLLQPMVERDTVSFPHADMLPLALSNGVPESEVESRWLVITVDSTKTYSCVTPGYTHIGVRDTTLQWDLYNVCYQYMPMQTLDLQLNVRMRDGRTLSSPSVHVGVRHEVEEYVFGGCGLHRVIRRDVMLYRPGAVTAPLQEENMYDCLLPYLTDSSSITVTGHTGRRNTEVHSLTLSKKRARRVAEFLRGKLPATVTIEARGVGEEEPLYTNELPEGRWLNEMVQIIITDPVQSIER